jgi:hypothetical protein
VCDSDNTDAAASGASASSSSAPAAAASAAASSDSIIPSSGISHVAKLLFVTNKL